MDNYNPVSLQGGGQDPEANPEEDEVDEGLKKEETTLNTSGGLDPLTKLPGDTL